ncbi:MAG: NAD(P)H-dependent oxidoreductase [Bacteroidota bacterium]
MKKVVSLAGSNSKQSINKQLVNYTSSLMDQVEIIPLDLNDFELPIYGIDHESDHGIPTVATDLNQILSTADGFVISLAEHNGSYAAVFKNTIDWLSRIKSDFWNQQPMLLMSTSPGGRGGATVLQSALSSFPFMGANVVESFSLPSFQKNFSEGSITDPALRSEHQKKVAGFLKAIH